MEPNVDPRSPIPRPGLPPISKLPHYGVLYLVAVIAIVWVVNARHLPERMDCRSFGSRLHCTRGLLDPQTWAQPLIAKRG